MVSDPLAQNAVDDLDQFAKKLAAELHAEQDHAAFKMRMLAILWHYGPVVAEAVLREALTLAGVPIPAALPQP